MRSHSSMLAFEIERLERRQLLAGTVTVVQSAAGDITVRGDGQANWLSLSATPDGDLELAGANTFVRIGSSVASSQVVPLENAFQIARHLRIRLGAGNDIVAVDGLEIRGLLDVNLAAGNDAVTLSNLTVSQALNVRGAAGVDRIDLAKTTSQGSVGLFLNAQNGSSTVSGISMQDVTIQGRLNVVGSAQNDHLFVSATTTHGTANVRTLGQNDVLIVAASEFRGTTTIDVGTGDDTMDLESARFVQSSRFRLGRDDDLINFLGAVEFVSPVTFDGSAGDDALLGIPPLFQQTVFKSIEVNPFA